MQYINPEYLSEDKVKSLRQSFDEAKPYRHIVMDNFLKDEFARKLDAHFPGEEIFSRKYKGYNENKAEGSKFDLYDPAFSKLRAELSSPEFNEWIAKVTGIEETFITEDGLGAGLHKGGNGSFLDIHIDFNIHPTKDVHRRLNLLIYLTPDWDPSWNGAMEMWNADMTKCEKEVECKFNRALIFETSEISYHGYTKKLKTPENVHRQSFYAYFYTKEREGASGYHDTVFRARPDDTFGKRVRTQVKETLKNTVKATLKKLGKPM